MWNKKTDLSYNKNGSYLKGLKEHLKEKLAFYETQIDSSNQLNRMTKSILNSYNNKDQSKELLTKLKTTFPKEKRNISQTSKIGSKRATKHGRTSCDLINYVKLRQTYMQHTNYWHQVWLFTQNPLFQFDSDLNGKFSKKKKTFLLLLKILRSNMLFIFYLFLTRIISFI